MYVCQSPHQIKTLNLVVDIHIYVCMYVKAHTRGFSFCFSSFLRLLVLPSIQSNQSINTELDVTIRWFTSKMKFISPARRERERERERKPSPHFFPCGRVLSVLFLCLLDWLLVIVFYDLLKSQAAVERYETIAISIESTCVLRLFSVNGIAVRKELWELYDRLTTIHDL